MSSPNTNQKLDEDTQQCNTSDFKDSEEKEKRSINKAQRYSTAPNSEIKALKESDDPVHIQQFECDFYNSSNKIQENMNLQRSEPLQRYDHENDTFQISSEFIELGQQDLKILSQMPNSVTTQMMNDQAQVSQVNPSQRVFPFMRIDRNQQQARSVAPHQNLNSKFVYPSYPNISNMTSPKLHQIEKEILEQIQTVDDFKMQQNKRQKKQSDKLQKKGSFQGLIEPVGQSNIFTKQDPINFIGNDLFSLGHPLSLSQKRTQSYYQFSQTPQVVRHFSEGSNLSQPGALFKCSFEGCEASFTRKQTQKNHEIRVHNVQDKPHKCPHEGCEKSYVDKTSLNNHLNWHDGYKPYPCTYDDCGKRFTTEGHLRDHTRIHTGEKPYVCYCGQAFSRNSTLTIHKRRHTKEKPFDCKTNQKDFRCPFKECQQEFTTKSQVATHVLSKQHSEQMPYLSEEVMTFLNLRSRIQKNSIFQSGEEIKKENTVEVSLPNCTQTEPSSEASMITQEKRSVKSETFEVKRESKRQRRNEKLQGELSEIMNSLKIMDGSKSQNLCQFENSQENTDAHLKETIKGEDI